VRQYFGDERHDHPAVAVLINALCQDPPGQWLNPFLPTQPLQENCRVAQQVARADGPAPTAYARVLAARAVTPATQARLRAEPARLNPFPRARESERQQKAIVVQRPLTA
jgi:hypothetical protein